MIILDFNIEIMTTEYLQEVGEKWLLRLPQGRERKVGRTYLYNPSMNRTKAVYGNFSKGRQGTIEVLLEIIANVLIHEHGQAQLKEHREARSESRQARIIEYHKEHVIKQADIIDYRP